MSKPRPVAPGPNVRGERPPAPTQQELPILTQTEQEALAGSHGGSMRGIHAVSFSRLQSYQRCGEAFRLQNVERVPQVPGGAAIAGRVVHQIIEEMILDGWYVDPAHVAEFGRLRFLDEFPKSLEAEGAKPIMGDDGVAILGYTDVLWGGRKHAVLDEEGRYVKDENGKTIKTGEEYLWMCHEAPTWIKRAGTILRADADRGLVFENPNVELRIAAWLDGPGSTLITGIIDLMLLRNDDGEQVIRDWKTGTFTDPMQLANYAWLLRSMEYEDKRIHTNIGQIAYLRGKKQEDWLRTYDLTDWVPLIPGQYRQHLIGIEAGHFSLNPSPFCKACWVREHCAYGRTLDIS